MTTLLVGNNRTEEMLGDLTLLSPEERQFAGCGAQRLIWFASDGDVLVLPWSPDDAYVDYVTSLTGVDGSTLSFVVPPPGHLGKDILSADRLADPVFLDEVRAALAGRSVDEVYGLHNDAVVVALARSLDAPAAVPGHGFLGQGGSVLVNSKAAFRAVAMGVGAPVAPGSVVANRHDAEQAITECLNLGWSVMVKQEFHLGGDGNEILSPVEGVLPSGAHRVVVLPDRAAVGAYLSERWDWLSDGGRHRLVVERFYPNAVPVYAEFLLSDIGSQLRGVGEMITDPVVVGEVIPAPSLAPSAVAELVAGGRRLCEPFHAMGYRGRISADAYVTEAGEILFSETNGRLTGSTHLIEILGRRIAGEGRVVLERGGWSVPSFRAAAERLVAAGIAYDENERTGVILVCDFGAVNGTVRYCVVARDIGAVYDQERTVKDLFTHERTNNAAEQLR